MTLVYCMHEFCGHLDRKEGTCDLAVILVNPGGCRSYLSEKDTRKVDGRKDLLVNTHRFTAAANEAFEKAGIVTGQLRFVCPICGGKAIGNRYKFNGAIYSLGSGCTQCGITHS